MRKEEVEKNEHNLMKIKLQVKQRTDFPHMVPENNPSQHANLHFK